jgi:class 3 adenylate cyclase
MASGGGEATGQAEAARLSEDARRRIRARASPEGIVTILFTDVVESTRLRQRLGDDAAQELFREHNRILRAQMEKHGGFEVKTYGDGFMVAFASVVSALACAIDIQRGIAEHNREHPEQELQVRIGLNCGQVIREEEDFFGSAVVIAARIGDLAKGGQILVSEMVRGLAGPWEDIRYVHYGRRHLKGLTGSYDIWEVPWRQAEVRGFAGLWANAAFRLTALVVLLAAIGGGVAGALVLTRGGAENGAPQGAATFQDLAIHLVTEAELQEVSGDCVSEDLIYEGSSESNVTGDISGRQTTTFEATLYALEGCQLGINSATFTITDPDGNKLSGTAEGPISIARLLEASATSSVSAVIITGGTGIYEGAAGHGTCTSLGANTVKPDGSVTSHAESDCEFDLATAGAAAATPEPVIVQVATGATEVTVFGGSVDLPNTVDIVVLYRNARDQTQKGLSLKLPVPQGAQILAAARGEQQPVSAGERIWRLPDLQPGALERFEFTLQLLAAETPAISLVVEVEGEGFERPVSSDPVAIKVTQ